jgi:uncharacterized protein (DUF58 family)
MLTSEILGRVREIQVRTGRQVADVLAGEYVSVFKGRGVEFDEVRPYVPGDDVRTIDWNVTARMGEPYIKRYVEERQLTLMLMADVSASQDFGSVGRSKRESTAELCALLAFSATRNDDKVGLALFHGDIEQYIPPRKGQKHALRVVREVLAHGQEDSGDAEAASQGLFSRLRGLVNLRRRPRAPRESTDIRFALEFFMKVNKRRTICFVVSDFLDEGYQRSLAVAAGRHDVIALRLRDPREVELPRMGLVAFQDLETDRRMLVDTSDKRVRRAFAQRVYDAEQRFAEAVRSTGVDHVDLWTGEDVVAPLAGLFRRRVRRMSR